MASYLHPTLKQACAIYKLTAALTTVIRGGSLIDIVDGKVLGIVTRKATGLTKDFESLDTVLQSNIELLNRRNAGSALMSGIDPIATTRMIQE